MISVPVYNMSGERTGEAEVDEAVLGGKVRYDLLKQAVVLWQSNRRQGSARTKNRSLVEGSTRKLYRQKGTGNARMGTVRTCVRRGGGVAHAKRHLVFERSMPRRMRQAARNSAVLAKLKSDSVAIIESIAMEAPRTRTFYAMLKKVGADRGCVVALGSADPVVVKSGRNIPRTEIVPVHDLNAYEILRRRKLLFTREAWDLVVANPRTWRREAAPAAGA